MKNIELVRKVEVTTSTIKRYDTDISVEGVLFNADVWSHEEGNLESLIFKKVESPESELKVKRVAGITVTGTEALVTLYNHKEEVEGFKTIEECYDAAAKFLAKEIMGVGLTKINLAHTEL